MSEKKIIGADLHLHEEQVVEDGNKQKIGSPIFYGKVNCAYLNIRKEPSVKSQIIKIYEKDKELCFENINSKKDAWLKLSDEEGYCMSRYIDC